VNELPDEDKDRLPEWVKDQLPAAETRRGD
jgi:hypothetical protein